MVTSASVLTRSSGLTGGLLFKLVMCVASWHELQSYALTFNSYLGQICAYPYFQSNICLNLLLSALNVKDQLSVCISFSARLSRPKLYKQCSRVILPFR
jgi:hypothetical protein